MHDPLAKDPGAAGRRFGLHRDPSAPGCLWTRTRGASAGPVPGTSGDPASGPIPTHARETLAYIREHGFAPPGYVGGRIFGNYEGLLPRYNARRKRIEYREWDVRPKAEGRNRGAERLVTGSDGRAWYSADHYRSFLEVK